MTELQTTNNIQWMVMAALSQWLIAVHEAAHAIMFLNMGVTFSYVEIYDTPTAVRDGVFAFGAVWGNPPLDWRGFYICVAGGIAGGLFAGGQLVGVSQDAISAREILRAEGICPESSTAHGWLRGAAELVYVWRDDIRTLAWALLSWRRLTQAQVKRLLRGKTAAK